MLNIISHNKNENQITMIDHFISSWMLKLKRLTIPNAGENVEQSEHCILMMEVWNYVITLENSVQFLRNLDMYNYLEIPFLVIYSQEKKIWSHCYFRWFYTGFFEALSFKFR